MPRLEPSTLRLSPRHLAMLLELLHRHVPDAEVWAYGSRVNGDCHDASDLDLVLRNPAADGSAVSGLPGLAEALVESNLPIKVDVVDWSRIPDAFRREIERAYVLVQEGRK